MFFFVRPREGEGSNQRRVWDPGQVRQEPQR